MRFGGTIPGRGGLSFAALLLAGFVAGGRAMAADSSPPAAAQVLSTLIVSPDLDSELAKFKRVRMPFHARALNARERKMIGKLVNACRAVDQIYWQQSDPDG